MSYKFIKEDEHTFQLQHPDGSAFRIAKHGLKDEIVNHIKSLKPIKMSDGGEVPDATDASADDAAPPMGKAPEVPQVLAPPEYAASAPADAGPAVPIATDPSKLGLMEPSNQPQPMPAQQNPMSGMSAELADIQKKQASAITAGSAAQAAAQKQTAGAYDQYNQQLAKLTADSQAKFAAIDKEHDDLVKQYASGQIDPNRIFKNMGTGSKITAAIGLILGGVGASATGGQNMALKVLNDSVDKDIDSQKANMGKTANLLTMNMQKYHNAQAAEAATRLNMSAALQGAIGKYAAQSGSASAIQQGQLAIQQLRQQDLPMKQQIAMTQAVAGLANGTNTGGNPEYYPDKVRERLVSVPGPNGQPRLVPTANAETANKFKEAEVHTDMINSKIQDALKFMDEKGISPGVLWMDSEDSAKARSIQQSLLSSMSQLHDLNRLTDTELEMYQKMVPNPGQFNQSAARVQLEALAKLIQEKRQSSYKNLLEGYNPGSIQEGSPVLPRR